MVMCATSFAPFARFWVIEFCWEHAVKRKSPLFSEPAFGLAAVLALGLALPAWAEENQAKQVVYIEPVAMIITSAVTDLGAVSLGYERKLGTGPFAALFNLHVGYDATTYENARNDTSLAYGAGFGLRRYFSRAFSGSYATGQTDLIMGYISEPDWSWDPISGQSSEKQNVEEPLLSITQLSIGYKWQWKYLAVDASIGGALYIHTPETYTMLIGALNIGAPF
jgi:hypothetical protein